MISHKKILTFLLSLTIIVPAAAFSQESPNLYAPRKGIEPQDSPEPYSPGSVGPEDEDSGPSYEFSPNSIDALKKALPPDPNTEPYKSGPTWYRQTEEQPVEGLLPNFFYIGRFVRPPESLSEGDFILRIFMIGTITGCVHVRQPDVKINDYGPVLEISMKKFGLTRDDDTRYGTQKFCPGGTNPYIDIPLNRDDLIKKGIKKLAIRGDAGRMTGADITASKERVTAKGELCGSITLAHWFLPENTVILNAPRAPMTEDLRERITRLARSHGLAPLEEKLEGFKPDKWEKNNLYFVDPSGTLVPRVKAAAGKSIILDALRMNESFYGANGPYDMAKDVEIFARLPNIYE